MRTVTDGARWVWAGRTGTAATLQTLLARVFILAVNIATGIITARLLGPEGRGEQAATIMWPQFLAFAMTLGLPAALLYNLKRYPLERSQLFCAAVQLSAGLGVVATVTGIVFIPYWLPHYSPEVIRIAQWFMPAACVGVVSVTLMAVVEALGEFAIANHVRTFTPLGTLFILGGLAIAGKLTPFTAGLAYLLPGLPIFFWLLAYLWKIFQPRWRGLGPSYNRLLGYGLRSYGIDLLGTLSGQVDQALVIGLLPPASMGMYAVALSLSRMLNLFHSSIITVLFPKAAARPVAEVVALTGRAARASTALTFLAAVAVMLLGPVLLHWLYGSEYAGAVPVFRILLIEVVLSGTTWVLAQAFMALGKPGTVTILQGIGLGLSVPLMLILIPTRGLEGAGLALLASTVARLILLLASFPLILKVPPPGLFVTREDVELVKQKLRFKR